MNRIDERLQAYLDGEMSLESLPPELRERAAAWEGLLDVARTSAPAGAPLGMERRVLEALEAAGRPRGRPAWIDWILRPRTLRVSPLAAAAATAAIALLVLRPWTGPAAPDGEVARSVFVQFVVEAPGARSVQLAGDFSDWQPGVSLSDPDGDGVWSGRVPLEPGVHEYMFVIDGSEWMPDPNATSSTDDGFGRRNSVVAVSAMNGT